MGASYVAVCGIDPWRDGGVIFANELRKENVPVNLQVYPGQLHCWWSTFPQIEATKLWLTRTLAGMRWVLDNGRQVTSGTSKL